MTMKLTFDMARKEVSSGIYPKEVIASNKKTGWSILDNVPQLTCYGACPIRHKCYDVKLLKIRPTVLRARARRHFMMEMAPDKYVEQVVKEIVARNATKVRIYGGGDFAPHHYDILVKILRTLPKITFYMISKTIREYPMHAIALLEFPNFFLNISECKDYLFGEGWEEFRVHPRVNFVYTLLPDDGDYETVKRADIVFNVSRRAKDIAVYKMCGIAMCPCDAHDMPAEGACGKCGLCSTKGGVRCAN